MEHHTLTNPDDMHYAKARLFTGDSSLITPDFEGQLLVDSTGNVWVATNNIQGALSRLSIPHWGDIEGTIADQEDLQQRLSQGGGTGTGGSNIVFSDGYPNFAPQSLDQIYIDKTNRRQFFPVNTLSSRDWRYLNGNLGWYTLVIEAEYNSGALHLYHKNCTYQESRNGTIDFGSPIKTWQVNTKYPEIFNPAMPEYNSQQLQDILTEEMLRSFNNGISVEYNWFFSGLNLYPNGYGFKAIDLVKTINDNGPGMYAFGIEGFSTQYVLNGFPGNSSVMLLPNAGTYLGTLDGATGQELIQQGFYVTTLDERYFFTLNKYYAGN